MTDPEPVSARIAGLVWLVLMAVSWLAVGALLWLLGRCWRG